jgi:biotin synthase
MQETACWSEEELRAIHDSPLLDLIYKAASIHRLHHAPNEVQVCSLLSIKTGGCSEDCKYCPQSSRYQTDVNPSALLSEEEIVSFAKRAIEEGATRVCLGAAWRLVREGPQFEKILRVIRQIGDLGVEVCCTLGMLTEAQALRLKEAGLYAYNHNLDTSARFYSSIITTRTYADRLKTLDAVEKAKISVCCGGIIGMGESIDDRIALIHTLTQRNPPPESVPINALIPIAGTPLQSQPKVPIWDLIRMIATVRIALPKAMVRLSAGRLERSLEEQALCFLAGANSIFSGEKLLTRPNPNFSDDAALFRLLGIQPRRAFAS